MKHTLLVILFIATAMGAEAQKAAAAAFHIVPLGVKGGSDESNLSAYAVAAENTEQYVCLDAGTIYTGIRLGIEHKSFKGTSAEILKDKIKGYLISHPHLDHVSGLLLNSQDDSSKPIYALQYTIDVMVEKYFSWKSWANWSDKGEAPQLGKYKMTTLEPGAEIKLENTSLFVAAFILSHTANSQSTAFLVRSNDAYLLYLGDTGADEAENSTRLQELWKVAGPLIKQKKLKGILIETSFDNAQPDRLLFGHFTPGWLMEEMGKLESISGKGTLENFPLIITHMKPGGTREETIKTELQQLNSLKVKLIFPEQGKKIEL